MHFVYQGFTHDGDIRSFAFQGIDERRVQMMYSIRVSLLLFARHRVAMQEAPAFCLHLLTDASASTPPGLEKFYNYQVVEEDLLPIVADRARRELQKAYKSSSRRLVQKPSVKSQFHPAVRTRD